MASKHTKPFSKNYPKLNNVESVVKIVIDLLKKMPVNEEHIQLGINFDIFNLLITNNWYLKKHNHFLKTVTNKAKVMADEFKIKVDNGEFTKKTMLLLEQNIGYFVNPFEHWHNYLLNFQTQEILTKPIYALDNGYKFGENCDYIKDIKKEPLMLRRLRN
uniref:Uncharacterized protein n=1 Tax=viral metagenome TaxID=1070528 RepID=A0A6C0J8T6_9ZZZZ